MSTAMMEQPMAIKRNDASAKVDAEVLGRAKIAASIKGLTLVEYLTEVIAKQADADIEEWKKQDSGKKPKR